MNLTTRYKGFVFKMICSLKILPVYVFHVLPILFNNDNLGFDKNYKTFYVENVDFWNFILLKFIVIVNIFSLQVYMYIVPLNLDEIIFWRWLIGEC